MTRLREIPVFFRVAVLLCLAWHSVCYGELKPNGTAIDRRIKAAVESYTTLLGGNWFEEERTTEYGETLTTYSTIAFSSDFLSQYSLQRKKKGDYQSCNLIAIDGDLGQKIQVSWYEPYDPTTQEKFTAGSFIDDETFSLLCRTTPRVEHCQTPHGFLAVMVEDSVELENAASLSDEVARQRFVQKDGWAYDISVGFDGRLRRVELRQVREGDGPAVLAGVQSISHAFEFPENGVIEFDSRVEFAGRGPIQTTGLLRQIAAPFKLRTGRLQLSPDDIENNMAIDVVGRPNDQYILKDGKITGLVDADTVAQSKRANWLGNMSLQTRLIIPLAVIFLASFVLYRKRRATPDEDS